MLTAAAWNAFLKTLEEPPPHTIFVLATTEANKVLPTVVDRCHRFDFGRPVGQPDRVGPAPRRRRRVDRDPRRGGRAGRALGDRLVPRRARDARAAAGVLRARRSRSTTCSRCSAPPTPTCCSATVDAVADGDARAALLAAARLAESGRDLGRFFGDLEAHARGLMIVQVLGDVPPELHVTPEQDERLAEQAERVSPADVVRLLELIAAALRAMKDGADARTQLELALVKAATPELEPSVKALQTRLERLERARRRRARRPARGDRRRPRGDRAAPPPRAPRRRAPRRRPRAPRRRRRSAASARSPAAAAPDGRHHRAGRGPAAGARRPRRCPARPPSPRAARSEPPTTPRPRWRRSSRPRPIPAPAVTAVATVDPDAPAPAPSLELSLEAFGDVWPAVVDSLREETPMLAAALDDRRARRARRPRADARVAGVVGVPQAQGRGSREPRADREGDPLGHRLLAAARLRAARRATREAGRRGAEAVRG